VEMYLPYAFMVWWLIKHGIIFTSWYLVKHIDNFIFPPFGAFNDVIDQKRGRRTLSLGADPCVPPKRGRGTQSQAPPTSTSCFMSSGSYISYTSVQYGWLSNWPLFRL
jgi:hypothetical protein